MLSSPWPWSIAGALIGLTVPALLLVGNKSCGISSSVGAIIATLAFQNPEPIQVNPALVNELAGYGITDYQNMVPSEIFNWSQLGTARGMILMVAGGFLVGFGTRYAGGCTSGHAIMGLSNLQWPSLIATCCFMAGGFITANLILPLIMRL